MRDLARRMAQTLLAVMQDFRTQLVSMPLKKLHSAADPLHVAQQLEALLSLAEIGTPLFDRNSKPCKSRECARADGAHLGMERRDTEIGTPGNSVRRDRLERCAQERHGRCRQRQRILRMLAY